MVALADDQLAVIQLQVRMELGAGGALHAVIGPQNLGAIRKIDSLERLFAGVGGSEREVIFTVPVLCKNDMVEFSGQLVDDRNDLIPFGHGERAVGAEI